MRIYNRFMSILLVLLISTSLYANNPKRPWTFFVYIAADNNLNPEADANIAQMVKSSSSENVYIVVHLNIKRAHESKKTQKLLIQNGKIKQIGQTTVEDSGSDTTFLNAMKWAVTDYPSDHLLVDVWNHGSGPLNRDMLAHRGVCYDDSTGNYMTDLKYKTAFDVLVNQYRNGQKIDIIAFDACLMADIEVAYTLQNYATYLVASQQTVPGPGYNYTDVLSIFTRNNPDPKTFAKWIIGAYDRQYKPSQESYTLSAMDLTKLTPIVTATNTIAQQLTSALNTDNSGTLQSIISNAADPSNCPHFDEPTYLDLYSFYANLYMATGQMGLNSSDTNQLKTALNNGLTSIAQCVVAKVYSTSDFSKTHGISAYFADVYSGIEPSYQSLYWTTDNPAWLNFLTEYVNIFNS
jgi:cysteine peptidase C11 family protein